MPRRTSVEGPPRSYVDPWPNGRAEGSVAAEYARQIALLLAEAMEGRSLRSVARDAGLDHTTVSALLAGDRWPDLVTLANLEAALGSRLWPDHPL